jgi:uncharacterized protein with PQ loop repeat
VTNQKDHWHRHFGRSIWVWYIMLMGPLYYAVAYYFANHPHKILLTVTMMGAVIALTIWSRK